ncbi:MAG: DsbA family protein [Gemmatimonadota bacterium]|nr:MAG: DsbA family protein [Gemmatimonadota bacterium]
MRTSVVVGLTLAAAAVAMAAGWTLRGVTGGDGSNAEADSTERVFNQETAMLAQRTKGDPDAPVTVFEVSDFQCPYCRKFWDETLPAMEREYIATGKIKLVFLNLPLSSIHPNAAAAHEFAMCAAKQDRFWPVHDLLFRYQDAWARIADPAPYFLGLADSVELDRDLLMRCFNNGEVRWLIQQETQINLQSGLRSTPTFVVEEMLIPGFAPIDQWRPVLDSAFARTTRGEP